MRPSRSAKKKLVRIAEIIEGVDQRCMAVDGPVTPTLQEMYYSEIAEIYELATNGKRLDKPQGRR